MKLALLIAVLLAVGGTDVARASTPENGGVGTVLVGGWASWYDVGPGFYAAAGPNLRAAVGPHWRGTLVEVRGGGRAVVVRLTDWCGCGDRHGTPTLLDLSRTAFDVLGDPAAGLIRVSIEVPNRPATGSFALPPTDTEETP